MPLQSVTLERSIARFFCQQPAYTLRSVSNTLTGQSFSVIVTLSAKFQWEGLTNAMTPILHIGQKVYEKNVNNRRPSIAGKMLTIPQTMWKSITNPAHSLTHIRRTITLDETNYNPIESDWVDDMLYEDDYNTNEEELPPNA